MLGCFGKHASKPQTGKSKPSHSHALQEMKNKSAFRFDCNHCGKSTAIGSTLWACQRCCYFECKACYMDKNRIPREAGALALFKFKEEVQVTQDLIPHPHALHERAADVRLCDVCKETNWSGQNMFSCTKCNYDECFNCHKKRASKPMSAPRELLLHRDPLKKSRLVPTKGPRVVFCFVCGENTLGRAYIWCCRKNGCGYKECDGCYANRFVVISGSHRSLSVSNSSMKFDSPNPSPVSIRSSDLDRKRFSGDRPAAADVEEKTDIAADVEEKTDTTTSIVIAAVPFSE